MTASSQHCPGSHREPATDGREFIPRTSVAVRGKCRRCGKLLTLTAYGYVRAHKPPRSAS